MEITAKYGSEANHTSAISLIYLLIFEKGVNTDAIDEPFNPRDEKCHRPSPEQRQNAVKSVAACAGRNCLWSGLQPESTDTKEIQIETGMYGGLEEASRKRFEPIIKVMNDLCD